MPDTKKSVVVDIVSDSRKFLNGFEDAIKEIEKAAKKANILGNMQDDIDALKNSIKDMGNIIQNIKPTTDDSALQKLQERIEKISLSVDGLKKDTKNIKLEIDKNSGKDIEKIVDRTKANILDTVDEMKQATAFLSDVFKIKVSNASLDETSKKILLLKKQVEEYKTIQKTLNEEEPKGYSNTKLKEASDAFDNLKIKYEQTEESIKSLKEQINSGTFDKSDKKKLQDYTIELSILAKEILAVQDRLYDFKTFDVTQLLDDEALLKSVNLGKQLVSNRIGAIEKAISDLSSRTVNTINEEVTKLEVKDGKIQIPIDLDQTASKLRKALNNVINELQSTVSPVTIPIQLVSAYKTNTKKEVEELKEIKALQSGIDKLTDENQKSIAQATLDKIKAQFKKELQIDIKTNISGAEKDIDRGIKAIQKVLKDNKIYIYPEIELTEENKEKINKELNDLLTNHKISLDTTELLDQFSKIKEELDKITDNTALTNWAKYYSNILDGISQKMITVLASENASSLFSVPGITELLSQLTSISSELGKIQQISKKTSLKNAFSIDIKEGDLSKFASSINNMAESLERLSKIDFSIPEIEKIQDKLNTDTSSVGIAQESTELTKLNKKLGETIKKINEKNKAFKEENKIVSSTIPNETEKIGKLVSGLTHVKAILEEINNFCKELDFANLNNLGQINKLKSNKIDSISTSLSSLAENINKLDLKDGNILNSIEDILNKADELKDLASVLKSTSSQIKEVKENTKAQNAQKLLTNSEDDIKQAGTKKLLEQDLNVLSTSLKTTSKGTIELIALVQDLNGNFKEYTLSTSNGMDFTTLKIEEGTNSVEKQAVTWKKLHEIIAASSNNVDISFIDKTSQLWEKVSQAAEEYKHQLGEIVSITRSVRKNSSGEALESFKITGASGNSVTIGAELENVALKQVIKGADNQATEHNKELIASYKKLIDLSKTYYELREKRANGTITEVESILLDDLIQKWDEAINKKNQYEIMANGSSKVEEQARNIQNEFINNNVFNYSKLVNEYIQNVRKQLTSIDLSKHTQDFNNQLNSLIARLNSIDPLRIVSESDVQNFAILKKEIDTFLNTVNDKSNKLEDPTSIYKLQSKIAKILEQNSAMSGKLKSEFIELQSVLQSLGTDIPADKFKELASTFQKLEAEMRKAGKTGKSFFDLITNKAKHASAQLIAQYLSLQDFIRYGRDIFNTIKEYDVALTEMDKVSNENIFTLKSYQQESFNLADSIGATAKQIQNSTADWMRLGESLEQAKQSAQDANILYNVSEFESIDAATESLVSMSQAFEELEKREIIDVVNNLGNNFAISTDGLATALQNSASALKTAKNDFFEAAALTTAANTVVQDPNKVGAGLRTIALRLTGTAAAKKELEELGEDVSDFTVTTVSKLNQKIIDLTKTQDGFGVSLLDMNGNYRSTYDILLDIAKVWDQIAKEDLATGENRQNALLEMMAGKNRSNILASILQSPEILKEAYDAALQSEGSALKENEAYLDSIEGHINQLTNSWQQLWINDYNREIINFFIDFAKGILDVINEVGVLNTALFGGGGIFAAIQTFKGNGRHESYALFLCF